MVRKRTRKYESDDNDSDSDEDFDVEHRSRPAPKKYSLRERKRAPLFTTADYDYYGLDDDDGTRRQSSDDEDFEVEADVNGARTYFEPDPDVDPHNSEGLIDFEDIIRADIVVNKNKIDYDNLIQKTEIKLSQPKKRGRKPKNRPVESVQETSDSGVVCEPELSSFETIAEAKLEETEDSEEKKENGDEKLEKEIGDEKIEKEIGDGKLAKEIGDGKLKKEIGNEKLEGLPNGDTLENGDAQKKDSNPIVQKTAIAEIMVNPPPIEEGEKVEEDDDDVIVLGELKQEVIVLDD